MVKSFMARIILWCLKGLGWAYFLMPRKLQIALGNGLGFLLYLCRFRLSVVRRNISFAFPESVTRRFLKPVSRQKAYHQWLIPKIYGQFGNLILETFMIFGPLSKWVTRSVDLLGSEHVRHAQLRGKGVIFLSSHLGNWEIMAAGGGILGGMDLLLVTKRLKPTWLHDAIEKGRLHCGVRGAYEPKTLSSVLSHLKKNGIVGFVLDQYAGPPVGVRVPFFGVPVGTPRIVAALEKRTGAAILPVVSFRTAEGRYVIDIRPALAPYEFGEMGLAARTAEYTRFIENDIRNYPEQWLWTHRRFKGDLSPLKKDEWQEVRSMGQEN